MIPVPDGNTPPETATPTFNAHRYVDHPRPRATPTPTATSTPTNTPLAATPVRTATPVGHRCADVDGNGRVGSGDLWRIFAATFRRYDARYDIDRNGRVNFGDVVAAAHQYGRRCRL